MQEFVLQPAIASADFTTAPLLLNDEALAFIQWLITGSDVAGSASVEVSADGTTYTAWTTATSVTSSADGHFNVVDCGAKYLRFVWDHTSGTGNISVKACTKNVAVSQVIAR